MDGNMLSNGYINCEFDSGNRLISAGGHTYTYNAEDVRIRNLCYDADTTYTYNTNCRLSQLLQKTTNGITTKYVYGLGLIGEEKEGCFKTYHFDYRGSTVAITDECGNIIDTLKYDTYGNVTEHIGDSYVIFGYNGRDGVVTDRNGLLYMRARYYSPAMRRFVNADILHGEISDSTSLNRYSYVNGNPVSFVDPFGLSKERGMTAKNMSFTSTNINGGYYVDGHFISDVLNRPCQLWESGKQGPLCPITNLDLAKLGYCTTCGTIGCCGDGEYQNARWLEESIIHFSSQMDICTDGPLLKKYGNNFHLYGDSPKVHQEETARLNGYVLPDEINYMVIPRRYENYSETMYSVGVIINNETGKFVYAIVCEGGPAENEGGYGKSAWDEVSIKAAWELNDLPYGSEIGNQRQYGSYTFVIFPRADYMNHNYWAQFAKSGTLQQAIDAEGSKYWR